MILKKISFKVKLIIFLEILFILVNGLLGFFVWKQLSFMVREISRSRLKSIAATTANLVEAKDHETLRSQKNEDDRAYIKIQNIFKKIKDANEHVDDIYTLRRTADDNIWTFVVGASDTVDQNGNGTIEEEEMKVSIGEEFDASECPELMRGWFAPSADYETNCDKWGCWLSGYAPVKNQENKTVAVVGVDIAADDIRAYEKDAEIIIIVTIALITVLLPIIIYPFLIHILKPISIITSAVKQFTHNLSTRIPLTSHDEFGIIAHTFNSMAEELQGLYKGLEGKVKEKTEQLKKKVDEIEKEKAKDEALLGSIGEGMIATDKKGKIIIANKHAQHILGYSEQELLGKNSLKILTLYDDKGALLPKEERPIYQALTFGKKVSSSYHYALKDGSTVPVTITASAARQSDKTIGVIAIFRDISIEKEIDKAKSEFVSLASHQLRTPLSSINWYTEMLLDDQAENLNDRQKKYLRSISEVSLKMGELVNSLLNVSRIEMGTISVEPMPIQITEFAKSVLDELQPELTGKKLTLKESISPSLSIFSGDPKLLRIIFQNLLTNAIKYTPTGGTIQLEISQDKDNLRIKVADSGYGIPKKDQPKIFSKLYRADNIKELEVDGTGLGLYIVKSIVDNCGGKIYFKSEENKGTAFYVQFPKAGMREKHKNKEID